MPGEDCLDCDDCPAACYIIIPLLIIGSFVGLAVYMGRFFGDPTDPDISFDVCVENGTLHTMDMDYSNSTLRYSLSIVFSFRNTKFGYGDIHRPAELSSELSYGGQQLGRASLSTFQVRYMETTMAPIDVRGQQVVGAVVARTYADNATRGYYTIQVKLSASFGGFSWCDSSCTLYFFPPVSAVPRGAPSIFDGEDCSTICATNVFHGTEQVSSTTVTSVSSQAASE